MFETGGGLDGPGVRVVDLSPDVASYHIGHAALRHGHPLDVNVVVTQSAQQGGLYLSFGGAVLDLAAASSSFQIEVGGALGARQLWFASGMTLTDLATAINAYSPSTGVRAAVVASAATGSNGIRLESEGFGNQAFTSVRVVHDGGISRERLGLYDLVRADFNAVNTMRVSDFHSSPASFGYRDHGLDIQGIINGHDAVGVGRTLALQSPSLAARITLTAGLASGTANAQTLGAMTAFRLVR